LPLFTIHWFSASSSQLPSAPRPTLQARSKFLQIGLSVPAAVRLEDKTAPAIPPPTQPARRTSGFRLVPVSPLHLPYWPPSTKAATPGALAVADPGIPLTCRARYRVPPNPAPAPMSPWTPTPHTQKFEPSLMLIYVNQTTRKSINSRPMPAAIRPFDQRGRRKY